MTKGDDGKIVVKKQTELKSFKRYETNTEEQQAFEGTQLLFGGNPDKNGGFFYIIPRNSTNEGVNIEIAYDIETIDSMLAATISDGLNHGVSVPNVIRKNNIFGEGVDFKAGYQYVINLHLGMTSLKVDADVQPWIAVDDVDVYVPDNQNSSSDEDNLPPAGTTIALTTMTTPPYSVTFTTDGTFKGDYMAGKISGSAADLAAAVIDSTKTYYIPSTAKDGDTCELLTFTGDATAGNGGTPSRRMEDGAETEDSQNFVATGIFVKVGTVTLGQGGGSGTGN